MSRARGMRLVASVLLGTAVAAVLTYVAGEQTEVAVLRTIDAGGGVHDTKLWIVDLDGAEWVRVANPGREWFRRLRAHPQAQLLRGGTTRAVIGRPDARPETRLAIDRAFRSKYGWVDGWYGLLLRRGAVPIRLDPDPARANGTD